MVIIDYKWSAVQALLTITVKILKTQRWGKTTCFVCQDTLTSKAFLSPYTMCIQTHTHTHTPQGIYLVTYYSNNNTMHRFLFIGMNSPLNSRTLHSRCQSCSDMS